MSTQFLHDYRESIACCYIEAGRAGVRLAADVKLSPLQPSGASQLQAVSSAPTMADAPVTNRNGHTPPPAELVSLAQIDALFTLAFEQASEDKEVLGTRLRRAMGVSEDGPAGASVQKPTVWVNKTSRVTKNQWVRLHLTAE